MAVTEVFGEEHERMEGEEAGAEKDRMRVMSGGEEGMEPKRI